MSDQVAPPFPTGAGAELKWPKIVGILSLVFSGFGLFGAVTSFFTGSMLRFQMQMNREVYNTDPAAIDSFLSQWNWHFVVGGIAGLIMTALLLFGGISLLRHKKVCRPVFLTYGGVGIFFALYSIYIALGSGMIDQQMDVMFGIGEGQSIDDIPAAKVGKMSGLIGGVIGSLFGMLLPLFFLVWFLRSKIKADIASRFS